MKECHFCGKKQLFEYELKLLGGIMINACDECYEKYYSLDDVKRAERILESGYLSPKDAAAVREAIEVRKEEEAALREKKEELLESSSVGKCPKCGGQVIKYKKMGLLIDFWDDHVPLITSRVNSFSDALVVVPYRCSKCAYTEFYTPNNIPGPELNREIADGSADDSGNEGESRE